ncbi:hypothetical protein PR048_020555, partial [Dryococelus australis]
MKSAFLHQRKIRNVYIAYLEEHCQRIPVPTHPYAHKLKDELGTLLNSLHRCADGSFPHETIKLGNQFSNAVNRECKRTTEVLHAEMSPD